MEWHREGYRVTDDSAEVDVELVARFLAEESYWAPGIPLETVRRAVANSLCLSLFGRSGQVGFARLVTDRATFAYLGDVFVLSDHRGRGLGRWLAQLAIGHPDVAGVRWMMLATWDAHELYRELGFSSLSQPGSLMEIKRRPAELYGARSGQSAGPRSGRGA